MTIIRHEEDTSHGTRSPCPNREIEAMAQFRHPPQQRLVTHSRDSGDKILTIRGSWREWRGMEGLRDSGCRSGRDVCVWMTSSCWQSSSSPRVRCTHRQRRLPVSRRRWCMDWRQREIRCQASAHPPLMLLILLILASGHKSSHRYSCTRPSSPPPPSL